MVDEDQEVRFQDALEGILQDARSVQWASLRGAYGYSDASDHYRDPLGMLRVFATECDVDSGVWGDAYDDCFLAHVWHQYTIYPVTAMAIGYAVRIASLRSSVAAEPTAQIAIGLRLIAESAGRWTKDPESRNRELGEAVAAAFVAHGNYIRAWVGKPLEEHAIEIGRWIPEVINR